ncbi:hypothetical protein [Photorhabdus temperata]|uniref:Uncharacterized protein n=1 Tax=Photorhabdus temperata J3 TaxID=1389415 RepID=U7QST9_PHOTE|nr:hypothetical protein [Photorhabdus temperata]ERT10347.1 hypothetical protein O185_25390 [Photorhabdus temperata J3]
MITTILNGNNIAIESGNITVFNYDAATREYLDNSKEFLVIGVRVPAHSCVEQPLTERQGYTICRSANLACWEYLSDYIGKISYGIKAIEQ